MKIGLKVWYDKLSKIDEFSDLFDFFEVFVPTEMDLATLAPYRGRPITIHAAHVHYGVDLGDPEAAGLNVRAIRHALAAATIVDAPWVIVHIGRKHHTTSENTMLRFLNTHHDPRIIFENCPDHGGKKMLFATPEEVSTFLARYDAKMLLDFNHAISAANQLGCDPYDFIDGFYALKPAAYHVAGMEMDSKSDGHLQLFEAKNDYRYLAKLPADAWVALETDHRTNSRENHLKNIAIVRAAAKHK